MKAKIQFTDSHQNLPGGGQQSFSMYFQEGSFIVHREEFDREGKENFHPTTHEYGPFNSFEEGVERIREEMEKLEPAEI